jgi:hypothetical protein
MKPLFVALGLNVITKRFYDSRDVLSAVAIQRNVGAGCVNLPLCKSQQGSSPPGEGMGLRVSVLSAVCPANPTASFSKDAASISPSPPTELGETPSLAGTGEGARRADEGHRDQNNSGGRLGVARVNRCWRKDN